MDCPKQIILVSWNAEFKIRFSQQVDVTNKRIALSSIQYPSVQPANQLQKKRLVKDMVAVGEIQSVLILCDAIRENTIINDINTSSACFPLRCMDLLQFETYREHNLIEVKNPVFHDFNATTFLGLTIKICDLNGDNVQFNGGVVVLKLLIE